MRLPNVNYLQARVLLQELARQGTNQVVISPGSRSTPLAHTAMDLPEVQKHVVIDERSAAYVALGLARASGLPTVLICTSGTAAANYYPAVIEAAQSQTPLIVLSADRPLSLRNTGAPQTIDQSHLYGTYPRFFADLSDARLDVQTLRHVRTLAARAFAAAMSSPVGPVHINVPLDEPLAPIEVEDAACRAVWRELEQDPRDTESFHTPLRIPPRAEVDQVYDQLERALCGLIVCGPNTARSDSEADAILHLARQLGWPVLADIVSGVRFHGHPVIPHFDLFLREESLSVLAPDVVLAFGAYPTSKVLNTYLERHRGAHTIRIQPHRLRMDPTARASEVIETDVAWLCEELADAIDVARDSLLLEPFQHAGGLISAELEKVSDEHVEALYVSDVLRLWPDRGPLVFASSLPIRYADARATGIGRRHAAYAMRGANGIDGTLSFAAGIAEASRAPTLLVTGDLAFCHDLTGLMTARNVPNLTVLLLNNNGGGIFHFLPSSGTSEHFEIIQGTPHDLNLSAAGPLFGLDWQPVTSRRHCRQLLEQDSGHARVIEVKSSREENYHAHRALNERLTGAAVRP